jgi:hypothetical protein
MSALPFPLIGTTCLSMHRYSLSRAKKEHEIADDSLAMHQYCMQYSVAHSCRCLSTVRTFRKIAADLEADARMYLEIHESRLLAVAMSQHARLGEESPLRVLDHGVWEMIVSFMEK